MTLDEAEQHLGEGVVYRPAHGPAEDGTIVGTSDRFVFVQYVGDRGAKATDPGDLTLLAGFHDGTVGLM